MGINQNRGTASSTSVFFITKVVYLPPVKLGVVLFDTTEKRLSKLFGG
jgi:hypothetical protein